MIAITTDCTCVHHKFGGYTEPVEYVWVVSCDEHKEEFRKYQEGE